MTAAEKKAQAKILAEEEAAQESASVIVQLCATRNITHGNEDGIHNLKVGSIWPFSIDEAEELLEIGALVVDKK